MKIILTPAIVLATALFSVNANALVTSPAGSDFQDGTASGWHIGSRGNTDVLQVTVGTEADNNSYLRYVSTGPGEITYGTDDSGNQIITKIEHEDSRVAIMAGADYKGNWSAMGIKSVTARMKNNGPVDLRMHSAFGNSYADLRTRYATEGVDVAADGQWHDVVFSLTEGLHMVSNGGHGKSSAQFSVEETMGNVVAFRFTEGYFGEEYFPKRRGPFEGYNAGRNVVADLWIDDIQFSTSEAGGVAAAAANVSAVPVPGAVWLFTSAITGLIVSRKRKI